MGLLTNSVNNALTRSVAVNANRGWRSQMDTAFKAASVDRLTEDWARALLSPDQEIRTSLRALRGRSRSLSINNGHARRFLNAAMEQVVGDEGVSLEMLFTDEDFTGAEKWNAKLEKAWKRYCECATADGKLDFPAATRLWLCTVLADGETFTQKLKGYPHNDSKFAIQFIDADQVDVMLQRLRNFNDPASPNEIRMGVEVDQFRRAIAYHIYEGHPSEFAGVVRRRIPADEMDHAFVFLRYNQTRGIPWMAPAMLNMHMLGEYDFAEVTASRWAACKMAFFVSKAGEEGYEGGERTDDGDIEINAAPGTMDALPEGVEPKVVDWQHPSGSYESFSLAALRGIAAGLDCSYTTLTGDLRSVNYSSIRQGVITERDGWAVLQSFTVNRFCRPTFRDWVPMALLTRQIELPSGMTVRDVCEHALWTPRGWDWVDPSKDIGASVTAVRAGLSTLQEECAKRGKDWRKVLKQRAKEIALAKTLGVPLDFTTSGAGGVEGGMQDEEAQRGVAPGGDSNSKKKGARQ